MTGGTEEGTIQSPLAGRAGILARRFAERASNAGLMDVSYTTAESPFGPLLVAATGEGLVAVGLPNQPHDSLLERIAARVSPRILESPARLDPVRSQLDAYFSGSLVNFDLPLDRRLSRGFLLAALDVVAAIPYGETLSYAEVAAKAGSPRAHRAAGSACATNPIPIVVPCHRVLSSSGGLGGYGGGLPMKRALLELEQDRPAPTRAEHRGLR